MLNPLIDVTIKNEELIINTAHLAGVSIAQVAMYAFPESSTLIRICITAGIEILSSLGLSTIAYQYHSEIEKRERQQIAGIIPVPVQEHASLLERIRPLRYALKKTLRRDPKHINPQSHAPYATTNPLSIGLEDINLFHKDDIYITKNNYGLIIKEYARYLKRTKQFLNPYTNDRLCEEDVNNLLKNPLIEAVSQLWHIRHNPPAFLQLAQGLRLQPQQADPIREQQTQRRSARLARRANANPY